MGITGLLPLLKPVTKDIHVSELKGLAVGIDTYCWLHKGIYSCSSELCQGIPTDKFIKYCVDRVNLLLRHGVRPYLVFDGGYLPAKAGKEAERRTRREANLQRATQLLREGNASGAHQFFSKAADVTPFMAHQLIQVIKRIPGVKYVVAPYEADAQLGFLARNGHVDVVITEDSDVLLFGCTRVVFKLDRDGTGQEVDLREIFSRRNDELDMRGMNEDDLVTLCALSGCDYLPSVPGVGLKKAYRLVARHKQLPKILKAIKFECAGAFPSGYEVEFQRALLTFRHQRAFDPISRTAIHMTPLPESLPDAVTMPAATAGDSSCGGGGGDPLDFLGPPIEATRASAVADGDVDPITGQSFLEIARAGDGSGGRPALQADPRKCSLDALAAWRGAVATTSRCAAGSGSKKLSAQGNSLTKYWGTPVSKKSPSRHKHDEAGTGSAERFFETDYTPERADRKRAAHQCASALVDEEKGIALKPADPVSPSTCVSPATFYGHGGGGGGPLPLDDDASRGKENRNPSSPVFSPKANTQPAAKSKHFQEVVEPGAAPVTTAPAGLRRRSLRPLIGDRATTGFTSSFSNGDLGEGVGGDRPGGVANPWEAEYASSRQQADHSGGSLVGSRLKRRKTLGLGSLTPKGVIRGLSGVASGDCNGSVKTGVGFVRRSKSLGGTPRRPGIEAGDKKARNSAAHSLVDNLFERFAASPPPAPTARSDMGITSCYAINNIATQAGRSGESAGNAGAEERRRSQHYLRSSGTEEDGGGGRGGAESFCGPAGKASLASNNVLLADRCHGDEADADGGRLKNDPVSVASRVDFAAETGSATVDRSIQGSRGGSPFPSGQGGHGLLVDSEALVRSRKDLTGVSGAACSGDLFAQFVYSPDR